MKLHMLRNRVVLALVLLMGIYVVVLSFVSLMRFYTFQTTVDLGIFNQAFRTALGGRLFYETPDLRAIPSGSFFGTHFSPLMFLLLPIYAILPRPETLLVLQTVFVALGALPIYLISNHVLKSSRIGLAMAGVYLVNPAIVSMTLYDFHLEAFLPFFLGMVYYLFLRKMWRPYFVFVALSLATIDFAGVLVVAISLTHLLNKVSLSRKNSRFLQIDLERTAFYALIFTVVIALSAFYLTLQAEVIFSGKSSSVVSNLAGFISAQPLTVDYYFKLQFWFLLLGSLLFLPVLAPGQFVMVLPWLLVTILTSQSPQYLVGYQFGGAFVAPYLIIASIYGLRKLGKPRINRKVISLILLISIVLTPINPLTQHNLPGIAYEQGLPSFTPHDQVLEKAIGLIPNNASVLSQVNLFPQVSGRANAYDYMPNSDTRIDYLLVDSTSSWYSYSIFGTNQSASKLLTSFILSGNYGVVVDADGVALLERGYKGPVLLSAQAQFVYDYQQLFLSSGSRTSDASSISGTVLVHNPGDQNGTFWFGPYVNLLPGNYSVTFYMKSLPSSNGSVTLQVSGFNATDIEVFAKSLVSPSSFTSPNTWHRFNLTFNLTPQDSLRSIEFRGVNAAGGPFYLDYILVEYKGGF
jgi:uncharacterized membrane protein